MFGILFILFLMLIALTSMFPLRSLARKKGLAPRPWELSLLLIWGFLWVGLRAFKGMIFEYLPRSLQGNLGFWTLFFLGCAVAYAIVFSQLLRRQSNAYWDKKLEEIGKEKTPKA